MARRDQPYLPLYIQDFMTDEKLAECSAAATGVYIRIMCLMHKSEDYGKITLSPKDLDLFGGTNNIHRFASKLNRHMPYPVEIIQAALLELIEEKVLYIENSQLCQKRMIKDGELSNIRAQAGKKGADITNQKFSPESKSSSKPEKRQKKSKSGDSKMSYAENVLLTEKEFNSLVEKFGEMASKRMIEILDNYKGANDKTYKSDYRAILLWVVDRYEKEKKDHGAKEVKSDIRSSEKGLRRDYEESF